jgi:hypothetical protein
MWSLLFVLGHLERDLDPSPQEAKHLRERRPYAEWLFRRLPRLGYHRSPQRVVRRIGGEGEHLGDRPLDHRALFDLHFSTIRGA